MKYSSFKEPSDTDTPDSSSDLSDESVLAVPLMDSSSSESIPMQQVQGPDWGGLLFGGKEKDCDEILWSPIIDTYYEDSKLAQDVALNTVSKYHLPVLNCLRNVNCQKLSSALNALRKLKLVTDRYDVKEILLTYILLLDFVSCCCQEGNLLTLYEHSKINKKIQHLDRIEFDLGFLLTSLKSEDFSMVQLKCLEKLVNASLERIPKTLFVAATYLKTKLNHTMLSFKSEDTKKRNFEYEEDTISVCKKLETSPIKCKGWNMLAESPTPTKSEESMESLSLSPSSTSAQYSSTPKSKKSHFIDTLFSFDDETSNASSLSVPNTSGS